MLDFFFVEMMGIYFFIFVFSRASWHPSAGLCWLPYTNGVTAILQGGYLIICTLTEAYSITHVL